MYIHKKQARTSNREFINTWQMQKVNNQFKIHMTLATKAPTVYIKDEL